ncbi:unnamed protein product [Gongylonema pulchrum]|uniref:Uncharacterized protein n=1 Tax=Gongylonema pulchrum TaxID=637853 RepID=A0A3P6SCY7_9BILA|nr:unnamed protein product [Gongylonema pulchrum]
MLARYQLYFRPATAAALSTMSEAKTVYDFVVKDVDGKNVSLEKYK